MPPARFFPGSSASLDPASREAYVQHRHSLSLSWPQTYLNAFIHTRLYSQANTNTHEAPILSPAQFQRAKDLALTTTWPQALPVTDFLKRAGLFPHSTSPSTSSRVLGSDSSFFMPSLPVLDVRSPSEYAKGHIPGALSAPLFTDEERADVGTIYKQKGHDRAVERGLEIVNSKGSVGLLQALLPAPLNCDFSKQGSERKVLVYCQRGGMRSSSVAHLLSQLPLTIHILEGGYKSFRQWCLSAWEDCDHRIALLAGFTGSGKTEVLLDLRQQYNAQVLDLEGDAHHRGSVFGALGRAPQPSNEQYENILALQWRSFEAGRTVFIEDESRHVGRCTVPPGLWHHMKATRSRVFRLLVPHQERVQRLVQEYGIYDRDLLADCVRGLHKRLGAGRVEELCALLEDDKGEDVLPAVATALLDYYYDKLYAHKSERPLKISSAGETGERAPKPEELRCLSGDARDNARLLVARVTAGGWEL